MNNHNEKALGEFMRHMTEAQERLAELQKYVDEHMHTTPNEISWCNVASAGYLVEHLTHITNWAFRRGEYAK